MIEKIKPFLKEETDIEEITKLISQEGDRRADQAVKTYQSNHEAERIQDLKEQIDQLQAEKTAGNLSEYCRLQGVPESLVPFTVGADQEETEKKVSDFLQHFNGELDKHTETKINAKLAGKGPIAGSSPSDFSTESLKAMTPAQVAEAAKNDPDFIKKITR